MKQMSVIEQVFIHLKSTRREEPFTMKTVHTVMPEATSSAVSAALYHLYAKHKLIDRVGKEGGTFIYKARPQLYRARIKFQPAPIPHKRKRHTGPRRKTATAGLPTSASQLPPATARRMAHIVLPNDTLKELHDIGEALLNLTARLDAIWNEYK